MIKINDFAASKGVSVQAIYKHLRNHKEALEGHYEKKGKNGTWLDDFACDFISELMIKNAIVVSESSDREEIERLKKKVEDLQERLANSNEKGRELAEKLVDYQDKMLELKDEYNNLLVLNSSLQLKIENHEKEQQEKKGFFARLLGK